MYIYLRGNRCGRNDYEPFDNGSFVVNKGESTDGNYNKYTVEGGTITRVERYIDHKLMQDLQYGHSLREWDKEGNLTKHTLYRKGSNRAILHKVSKDESTKDGTYKLGEWEVLLRQRTRGGHILTEEAKYTTNKRTAYKYYYGMKKLQILDPEGKLWVEIEATPRVFGGWRETAIAGITQYINGGTSVPIFTHPKGVFPTQSQANYGVDNWLCFFIRGRWNSRARTSLAVYDKGKIKWQGQRADGQKIGKWICPAEGTAWYLRGVRVKESLYDTATNRPQELDAKEVLSIPNAQLRGALITIMGSERFVKGVGGKIVHTDGDMELIRIASPSNGHDHKGRPITGEGLDPELLFLKVRCPSTGTYYILRVHPRCATCKEAKDWTFGRDFSRFNAQQPIDKEAIEYLQET